MAVSFDKTKEMLQAAARHGTATEQGAPAPDADGHGRICIHCPRYRYETGASRVLRMPLYHTFLRVMDLHDRRSVVFRAQASGGADLSRLDYKRILFGPPIDIPDTMRDATDYFKKEYSTDNPPQRSIFYLEAHVFDYEGSIEDDRDKQEKNKNKWAYVAQRTDEIELWKVYEAHYAISKRRLDYLFDGPNCNSYTMTIEKFAGFTPVKPDVDAPGWDVYLMSVNYEQGEDFMAHSEKMRL